MPPRPLLRVGIGGPVGSGKSSLVAALCRALAAQFEIGVVTNDIYTSEDARFLRSTAVLPDERIVAVETGCCPHTAIRDDVSANLEAIEELKKGPGELDIVLVESGGDNLTAVFSPALADVQIFVIDVAGGDDIPRKGGPGIHRADLLVINKTDLAPFVGADLDRMHGDATARRGSLPVELLSLRQDPLASPVADWVRRAHAKLVSGELVGAGEGSSANRFVRDEHGHDHTHTHPDDRPARIISSPAGRGTEPRPVGG